MKMLEKMQLRPMQKNGIGPVDLSPGLMIYTRGGLGVVPELLAIEVQVKITEKIIPVFYEADLLEYI